MNSMYRNMHGMRRQPPSKWGRGLGMVLAVLVAIGVFVMAVRWFRADATPQGGEGIKQAAESSQDDITNGVRALAAAGSLAAQSSMTFAAVNDNAAGGTAQRTVDAAIFAISVVADLPSIDNVKFAYEAWFVKPGITDFFSLGELYPREDGKWGLVWQQSQALVRSDIAEFQRVIIIREPRDGNTAPSNDHVLDGEF